MDAILGDASPASGRPARTSMCGRSGQLRGGAAQACTAFDHCRDAIHGDVLQVSGRPARTSMCGRSAQRAAVPRKRARH
jgi:hypothetical protein